MQLALIGASCVMGGAVHVNPIEKVVQLMDDLTAKITKEGDVEAKAFKEFVEWCDDAASNAKFAQKTGSAQQAKLEAIIDQSAADKAVAESSIEDLGKSIAASESELADATAIREKEHADFAAIESELVDTVDTLDRAIMMLEREMAKKPGHVAEDSKHCKCSGDAPSAQCCHQLCRFGFQRSTEVDGAGTGQADR